MHIIFSIKCKIGKCKPKTISRHSFGFYFKMERVELFRSAPKHRQVKFIHVCWPESICCPMLELFYNLFFYVKINRSIIIRFVRNWCLIKIILYCLYENIYVSTQIVFICYTFSDLIIYKIIFVSMRIIFISYTFSDMIIYKKKNIHLCEKKNVYFILPRIHKQTAFSAYRVVLMSDLNNFFDNVEKYLRFEQHIGQHFIPFLKDALSEFRACVLTTLTGLFPTTSLYQFFISTIFLRSLQIKLSIPRKNSNSQKNCFENDMPAYIIFQINNRSA